MTFHHHSVQWHQSGLKTKRNVSPTNSTDGGKRHNGIEGIIPGIFIQYICPTQIFVFLKSDHFGKCSHNSCTPRLPPRPQSQCRPPIP